jgi:magnesium transporter
MKFSYVLSQGLLMEASEEKASIIAFLSPNDDEKRDLVDVLRLDPYDVDSALDPDEVPRIEVLPERVSIILKRPKSATVDEVVRLGVSSIGLFLFPDRLVVVMGEVPIVFSSKEFQSMASPLDFLLRLVQYMIRHYVGHLKAIKQLSTSLEARISTSMENRYLLQMFSLSENLVYYLDAIEANGAAFTKLRTLADRLNFTKEQIDLLDDLLVDNHQCARQAQIYSAVLSGLMDARGTIVNNNMNVLLKNLTLINIIFLPLNLIASILGMSEFTMMTLGLSWKIAYPLFSLAMVLIGLTTWILVVRVIEKKPFSRTLPVPSFRSLTAKPNRSA